MQHNFFLAFHHQDNLSIENLNREIEEITEKAKFDPTPDPSPSGGTNLDMQGNSFIIGG